jgi:hypothetical protein
MADCTYAWLADHVGCASATSTQMKAMVVIKEAVVEINLRLKQR